MTDDLRKPVKGVQEHDLRPDQLAFTTTAERFSEHVNKQSPDVHTYAHVSDVSHELSKKTFGKPMPFGVTSKRFEAKTASSVPPPGQPASSHSFFLDVCLQYHSCRRILPSVNQHRHSAVLGVRLVNAKI